MRIVKMVILFMVTILLWTALSMVINHFKALTDVVSEASSSNKRFKTIHKEKVDNMSWGLYVLEDSSTGVKYLVIGNGEGLGITPIIDKEASKWVQY